MGEQVPAAVVNIGGAVVCAWCHDPAEGDHSLCLDPNANELDVNDGFCSWCSEPRAGADHTLCGGEDEGIPWNHPLTGAHEACVENGTPIPPSRSDFAAPCPDPESCPAR